MMCLGISFDMHVTVLIRSVIGVVFQEIVAKQSRFGISPQLCTHVKNGHIVGSSSWGRHFESLHLNIDSSRVIRSDNKLICTVSDWARCVS